MFTLLNNKCLLLTECEVRTVSYGPEFFSILMAQARSARAMRKKTRSVTYGTDRATRLIRYLLYGSLFFFVRATEERLWHTYSCWLAYLRKRAKIPALFSVTRRAHVAMLVADSVRVEWPFYFVSSYSICFISSCLTLRSMGILDVWNPKEDLHRQLERKNIKELETKWAECIGLRIDWNDKSVISWK